MKNDIVHSIYLLIHILAINRLVLLIFVVIAGVALLVLKSIQIKKNSVGLYMAADILHGLFRFELILLVLSICSGILVKILPY